MTEITPELKALADAAVTYFTVLKRSESADAFEALQAATHTYRATQAKECRPPDGAKRGDLFWLARSDGMKVPAGWMENDTGFYWDAVGHGNIIPSLAGANGWTVDSECRFGETGENYEQIKLCPFCGGEGRRVDFDHDADHGNSGGSVIECATCQASGPVCFGEKTQLIEAWNCRVKS